MSQVADDSVRPRHYTDLKPESIDVIQGWGLDFCLGNCVKYIARAGHKNSTYKRQDLQKAAWYLDRAITSLTGPPDPPG